MKLKVNYTGNTPIFIRSKNYLKILSALEETGVSVRLTELSKRTKIPVTTLYDFFRKLEENNSIEVVFNISGRRGKYVKNKIN